MSVPSPTSVRLETVVVSRDVVVNRLRGPARDPGDGRHRRVVVLVAADVTDRELVGLLHDVAGRLGRKLPNERASA